MSGQSYDRKKQTSAFLLIFFFFLPSVAFAQTPKSSPSRTILEVVVIGNTLLRNDQIDEAIAPFIGRDLSLDEINNIVAALTDAYRENRFFLVKVYLPAQEIKAGKIQISVLEGKIGTLSVSGNQFYKTSFIEKHFLEVETTEQGRLELFKRATLVLNDYPDLKAELLFKPGTTLGTADLEVMIKDEHPTHLSLDYNNFGSNVVSRHRFGIGFDMGNLVEDGHNLSLRVLVGSPINNLTYYRAEYTAPLDYTGKNGRFTYARGDFDVGGALEQVNIDMKTESVGLAVSYPFLKTHLESLVGEVGFEANNFRQTVLERQDKIRVVRGKADYRRFAEDTRDFLSVTLTQGLGSLLGGTRNNSPLTSRPGADDLFTKAAIDWVRVRSLPQPYFIPHRYSLIIAGSAQISSNSLVVGEQFSVGGPDSVRGYPLGEFLGDNGYRFSSELRVSPFADAEKIQAAIFFDHGGSFTKTQVSTEDTNHFLTGFGFGVRMNFPGAVRLREPDSETETPGYFIDYRFQVRADIGFPIGDRALSRGSGPILYLQAIGRF